MHSRHPLLLLASLIVWSAGLPATSSAAEPPRPAGKKVDPDHERLSFYHNGIERRLTDVHGHVIGDVLA